jgi:hypothetical protein
MMASKESIFECLASSSLLPPPNSGMSHMLRGFSTCNGATIKQACGLEYRMRTDARISPVHHEAILQAQFNNLRNACAPGDKLCAPCSGCGPC